MPALATSDSETGDSAFPEVGNPVPMQPAAALVIAEHFDPEKIDRHYGPLSACVADVTVVCMTPCETQRDLSYVIVPSFGPRLVGLVLMLGYAIREAWRNEYDIVFSTSLLPYGLYSLMLKYLWGIPAHLTIIGMDVDVHLHAWYRPLIVFAFGRFDSISVPGSVHRQHIEDAGISPSRVSILSNAVDVDRYRPTQDDDEPIYDYLWVGRFSEEKSPLLFIDTLKRLVASDPDLRGAMVGAGPLAERVEAEIVSAGLEEHIHLPGWVDEPCDYYASSKVFVLTSSRDALPLSLLEAMASGTPCVVPLVGSIGDVAVHRDTAYVVPERTPAAYARALSELLADDQLRRRISARARMAAESYSYEAAEGDWRRILSKIGSHGTPT